MNVIVAQSLGMILQVGPCSINIEMEQSLNPEMLLNPSASSDEKPEDVLLEKKPDSNPEMLRRAVDISSESPAPLAVHSDVYVPPINAPSTLDRKVGSDDDAADDSPNDDNMDDVLEEDVAENDDTADVGNKNHPFRMSSGLLPFPDKLMSLLDSDKVTEAMRWLRDGDAFCIAPALFTDRVLDKYFQGTKFESFTRKLNRWGFKRVAGQKVPPNMIAYYHKDFLRGSPKLLKNMNGGKKKMVSARERQLRAQQKQDQEREAASFALSTQNRSGLLNFDKSGSLGNVATLHRAPGNLGMIRSLDQMRLELLASNSMAIEQELNRRKLEQQQLANLGFSQFLDSKQAAMPFLSHQRDELQMQALLAQQRARQENASNNWLTIGQGGMQPSVSGPLAALRYLELQRNMQDPALSRNADMGPPNQFLVTQQTPSGGGIMGADSAQASILKRLIAEKIGVEGHLNARADAVASKIVPQELLNDQQFTKLPSDAIPSQPSMGSISAPGDQQLLELYSRLNAQNDTAANRIVQQQILNEQQQLTKLTSEQLLDGNSGASGDQQLLDLYFRQQQQSENSKRSS